MNKQAAVLARLFISLVASVPIGYLEFQSAEAETLFQDNFNSGAASHWIPQGGMWVVSNRKYVGQGTTSGTPTACGVPLDIAQSVISGLRATDVEVEVDMRSIERVDKFIVLR